MLRSAIKNIKNWNWSSAKDSHDVGFARGCQVSLLIEVGQLREGKETKGKAILLQVLQISMPEAWPSGGSQGDGATHILKVKYTRISRETYFECPAWVVKWKWNGIEWGWIDVVGVNAAWPRPIKISLVLAKTCPFLRMYYLCYAPNGVFYLVISAARDQPTYDNSVKVNWIRILLY